MLQVDREVGEDNGSPLALPEPMGPANRSKGVALFALMWTLVLFNTGLLS